MRESISTRGNSKCNDMLVDVSMVKTKDSKSPCNHSKQLETIEESERKVWRDISVLIMYSD